MGLISIDDSGVPPVQPQRRRPLCSMSIEEKDLKILALNARIQSLESALYAALRLRGLSEAYHDNLAFVGERRKYNDQMNDIEKQIREALQMQAECSGK